MSSCAQFYCFTHTLPQTSWDIRPKFASLVENLKHQPGLCMMQPFATWLPSIFQWHGAKLTNNATMIL